jgi:S-DNA-T family DNA segregation ATPase FtsK/SpoIIIE
MAVKKETIRAGWHEATGVLLIFACVVGLLSVFSYDPGDIGLLREPPQDPPSNFIGQLGAWFGFLTFMLFGVVGYLVPATFAYLGLLSLFKREGRIWPKALWLLVFLLAATVLVDLGSGPWEGMRSRLNIGGAGGVLGDVVATRCLTGLMGTVGTAIFGVAVLLVSLIMLFEVHPVELGRHLSAHVAAFRQKLEERRVSRLDRQQQLVEEERDVAKKRRRLEKSVGALDETPSGISKPRLREKVEPAADLEPEVAPVRARMREPARMPDPAPAPARSAAVALREEPAPAPAPEEEERPPLVEQALSLIKNVPAKVAARLKADDAPAPEEADAAVPADPPAPAVPVAPPPPPAPPKPRPLTALQVDAAAPTSDQPGYPNYVLPPLSLLDELPPPEKREVVEVTSTGAMVLKDTMAEFGVEVEVTAVERGPVVTRYELLPAPGVRVERISGLSNNIALAMKAESVRVQAPIPGKGVVGIEVPNPKTTTVYLREILESDAWQKGKAALPLAFGQDVGGRVLVADLADMPHLLVAGATGSGKTVCMNSVLAGLLMARTPGPDEG